jgi:hypothetical protein
MTVIIDGSSGVNISSTTGVINLLGSTSGSITLQANLQTTDWTSIADVGNPEMSNPYLVNQAEFIAYRSTVRGYAVNPVVNPVFPTQPTEQWSS